MNSLIFWIVVIAILRFARKTFVRKREMKPQGLCRDCRFVHMQYGADGRNAVFCTYGNMVRQVQIEVLYCTDYQNRDVPVRLVPIGFVRDSEPVPAEAGGD